MIASKALKRTMHKFYNGCLTLYFLLLVLILYLLLFFNIFTFPFLNKSIAFFVMS